TTPNVVVFDITSNISPSIGVPGIWMPGMQNADIDLGEQVINVQGVPAIARLNAAGAVEVDFAGTIVGTGTNTAGGGTSGINIQAGASGANIVLNSTADVTIEATRDPAISPYGNVGVVANGGANGS